MCPLVPIRLSGETIAELHKLAGRPDAAGALAGAGVGGLGSRVLRVLEVIAALINPAGAKADALIQVPDFGCSLTFCMTVQCLKICRDLNVTAHANLSSRRVHTCPLACLRRPSM